MLNWEAAAGTIAVWRNDLLKNQTLSGPLITMQACLEDAPSAKQFGVGFWVCMACDVLFDQRVDLLSKDPFDDDDAPNLEDLSTIVTAFVKNGHTVVKLPKKDMPSDISWKVEKLAKERAYESCSVFNSIRTPDSRVLSLCSFS